MAEWTGIESPVTVESLLAIGVFYGYNIQKLDTLTHNSANRLFCGQSRDGYFVVKIDSRDGSANELALLSSFKRHINIMFLAEVQGLDNFLVMPLYATTLTLFLSPANIHTVTFPQRVRLMRGIADAMLFVVKNRLVHGDVKPDNILVSDTGDAVLADFGICKPADKEITNVEVLDKLTKISNYTVEHGVGMQAVGIYMFGSDAIQTIKTLLSVLGIVVSVAKQDDILLCAARGKPIDLIGATVTQLRIYRNAVSDIMLLSEVNRARVHPMWQPPRASFIDDVIRHRLKGNGPFGEWCVHQRIVYSIVKALVMFTRLNTPRRAETSWRLLGNLFQCKSQTDNVACI